MEYVTSVGSRNDGTDKLRVLITITDAEGLKSEAIFDSPSDIFSFTSGRGYHFAAANVNDVTEINPLIDEFREKLTDFIRTQDDNKSAVSSKKGKIDLGVGSPTE